MTKKQNSLSEEEIRIKAVDLYKDRQKVSEICAELSRSRVWFYKWLRRYQSGDKNWYKDVSKAPKTVFNKSSSAIEAVVIRIRKELCNSKYSQYGAQAIHYELLRQGHTPPPVITINRILKRNNLVSEKRFHNKISKGKIYPYSYSLCQQMDFVGPRYLSGGIRFYFLNIIECETHCVNIFIQTNRDSRSICQNLIYFWKVFGLPDFLQMDNDLAFIGSLRHPGAFGNVIKLCFHFGIIPIFIPPAEPWRNGIIEHFNNLMQEHLLKKEIHNTLESLEDSANEFVLYHNNFHHYSSQQGMTPLQARKKYGYPYSLLDDTFSFSKIGNDFLEGEIHIIRFIRSDLKFNFLGKSFKLPERAKYEYVLGILITHQHRLLIFKDKEYLTEFQFIVYNNCKRCGDIFEH